MACAEGVPLAQAVRSAATPPRAATAAKVSREAAVEGQASPPGAPPPPTPNMRRNWSAGRVGAGRTRGSRRDSVRGGIAEYSQPVPMDS
jgi:hypothetical protein